MILYKYFPENINSIKALSCKSVWMNPALKMNDPLESLTLISQEYSQEDLNQYRKHIKESEINTKLDWLKYDNEQLIECLNFLRRNILSGLCFSSFSEDYSNILMWSHYASSHTGFCLAFEFSEDLLVENDLIKVKYSDKVDSLNIKSLMCDHNSPNEDLVEMKRDFYNSLTVKSPHWNYEKEWRKWGHPGYEDFDGRAKIVKIYFGYRIDKEFENIIRNILKSVDLENIEIKYMDIQDNSTNLIAINEDDYKKNSNKRQKLIEGTYVNIKSFI
ncbi:Protein of unknown function [Chryseobacterium rhizoplanae]|uniref:DUF2971 domain-containing protein n=1 Tax=Chryseobacterium rhizoplanae TaxID=1609531 RepID=A0A521D3V7_9FLAO|nr:DUF2971 domain-containing protein [Chryseobacterium rhizoplanae]SMO66383.1 Protein of unknown function [Chryseobacterium rhizoplanae]